MSVLYTQSVCDAAVDLLKAASLSFNPKLVQRGDLAFYPETALADIVPAVFVKATDVDVSIGEYEIGGRDVDTKTELRITVVDDFNRDEQLYDLRISRAEEVAEAVIASDKLNMDESITNYTIFNAWPESIYLYPQEDEFVSLNQKRKLFAVAMSVMVWGRATRT